MNKHNRDRSKLVNQLISLRMKNWSTDDVWGWMSDVIYHSYELDYIKECIKDEDNEQS